MLYTLLFLAPVEAKTPADLFANSKNLSLDLQRMYRHDAASFSTLANSRGWGKPNQIIPAPPTPFPEKQVRNAYPGNPQSHETDNFVVWWGPSGNIQDGDIVALGVELEHIWDVQIDQMSLTPPETADSWKFNVYIGDTGEGVPSAEGNAGFFWYDSENYPMMVLSSDIISWTDSAKLTAAHEFFHAVQAAIDTYRFNDAALWWTEATANWILEEVFPQDGGYSNTLYSVALRPEIALNHWGDYATEGVEADHHYGASIFATYLSENHGGWQTVIRSFTEAPINGDPLNVFETLLQEQGTTLADAHLQYALRNTTWDYVFEQDYEYSVADYTGGGESHRVSGIIADTSSEWHGPGDWPPHTYGANNWQLQTMPEVFTITFEGDSGIDWRVGIASQTADEHARDTMEMDEENGQLVVRNWNNADELWLVVAAIDDNVDDGETHSYEFKITEGEPEEEEATKVGACTTSPFKSENTIYGFGLFALIGSLRGSRRKHRKTYSAKS